MSTFPLTVVKNGRARVAHTPAELVRWKFQGYLPQNDADAAVVEQVVHPVAFDPSEHSAKEVAEYLSTADQGEYDRVYAAEVAGKNRSTALAE